MPRRPDVPCRRCGELMWRGKGALPPGEAMCQPCRRIEPQRTTGIKTPCADCAKPSTGVRCRPCRDIAQRDGKTPDEILEMKRELRRRRAARDRLAPGLTATQRRHLRAKWIKQRRACTYCPALATQVDHVIPLALGGTNYIGNLAPACADCNQAKCDNLLIEWRTGKKARRMRWAVEPTARAPRPDPKPKFSKVYFGNCVHCDAPFAGRNNKVNTCAHHRLWAHRPRPKALIACAECGQHFVAFSAKYCSRACGKRARRRTPEGRAAKRLENRRYLLRMRMQPPGLPKSQNQTAA